MSKPGHVHVIINPASGKDAPILNILNRCFAEHDIDWRASIMYRGGDGQRLAREIAQRGQTDLLLAYGGDGTVREVGNGLHGHRLPLGILPGGTGNSIAQEMGIPGALQPALDFICRGESRVQPLDGIWANEELFFLRADVGISSRVLENADRASKNRFGNFAYVIAGLRALGDIQDIPFELQVNGQRIQEQGAACVVANMGRIGSVPVDFGERVTWDDGQMDVFLVKRDFPTVMGMLASVARVTDLADVLAHWRCQQFSILGPPGQPVKCDGEPAMQSPVHFKMAPAALRVMVPAGDA
jgi:diacylglycerol kinase family enzyme